jgi:hypothetical protein
MTSRLNDRVALLEQRRRTPDLTWDELCRLTGISIERATAAINEGIQVAEITGDMAAIAAMRAGLEYLEACRANS